MKAWQVDEVFNRLCEVWHLEGRWPDSFNVLWETVQEEGAPYCYYPPDYGYLMVRDPVVTEDGYLIHLARTTEAAMFGEEAPSLWVHVEIQKTYRLRIKITDDKPR